MSGIRVRYSGDHANVGLDLGGVRFITEHTGLDHVSYMDVRFEHGLLQMTSEALRTLVRRGQEALGALPGAPDYSGALAHTEEMDG